MDGCKKRRTRRERLMEEYLEACLDDFEEEEDFLEELIEECLGAEESEEPEACSKPQEEEPDPRVCEAPVCELTKRELGRKGEDAACALLKRKGFVILERNWTCPFGEADIIALQGACLVFVEVKTRAGLTCGLPEDSVTHKKRSKYERIAACYLSRHGEEREMPVRFDVIGIQVLANGRALARHTVNAFVSAL